MYSYIKLESKTKVKGAEITKNVKLVSITDEQTHRSPVYTYICRYFLS